MTSGYPGSSCDSRTDSSVDRNFGKTNSTVGNHAPRSVDYSRWKRLLEVVSSEGTPHTFITLTSGSSWSDVLETIEYQKRSQQCSVQTTVDFHKRMETLLHNIKGCS